MSTYALDDAALALLATALDDLAQGLEVAGKLGVDSWAFGTSQSAGALEAVLGDWRHERLALVRGLRVLGERLRAVGSVYAETEAAVAGRLLVGGVP